MSLNIKNEEVHAAVRELADRLGVSQTSAVEQAVRARLEQLEADAARQDRIRRLYEAAAAAQRAYAGIDLWKIAEELYDEKTGLPQ